MARINMVQIFAALAFVAAALFHGTAADDFIVGDTSGWNLPSSTTFYQTWASTKTFEIGDRLVFNFATGSHDVTEVTKAAYDACTTASPINAIQTGPATLNLTTPGVHYYICAFAGHCSRGQKLAVTVAVDDDLAPGTTPPGTITPPSTTTPTGTAMPPASSASTNDATFIVTLMIVFIGLFC